MAVTSRALITGFAAGALAVPVFHQGMVYLLNVVGAIPTLPWSTRPVAPLGVPQLVNQMFWGGVWGMVFATLLGRRPMRGSAQRGVSFGLIGPWLLGNGVILPLIRGQALFFGLEPRRMLVGALIGAAFGLGLALFWRLLRAGARP